jgi:hypothetical protein
VGRIVLALTQPVRRSWLRRVVSCTFCWRTTFCLTPPCSWCSTSWIHRCVTPRLTTCSTSRAHPALGRRLCARPSPDSPEDRPTQFALSRSQLEMTLHLDSLPAEMRARCVPATSTQPHPVSPSTADAAACGDAQGGGFADQRADGSRRALHSDVDQVSAGTPLAAAHPLAPSTRAACACKQRIGGKRGCSATRETVSGGEVDAAYTPSCTAATHSTRTALHGPLPPPHSSVSTLQLRRGCSPSAGGGCHSAAQRCTHGLTVCTLLLSAVHPVTLYTRTQPSTASS